jgi:hypothetical protein
MAFVLADRVKETSTSTGTGDMTLAGAEIGYQSFAVIGNNNSTYYTIALQGGTEWEVGIGTYETTGPDLQRDVVLSNSLGTTAKISFSAGTKDVFVTYPSERSVFALGGGVTADTGSIYINKTTVTKDTTLNDGENGISVGTMTVGSGVNVTIDTGQRWLIV